MSTSGELPTGQVARDFAVTIATDSVREDLRGELRLQSGAGLRQHSILTVYPTDTPGAQYVGLTVTPLEKRLDPEVSERLHIPMDRAVWLARSRWAHLSRGDSGEESLALPKSNHTGSGYFWRNDDESWGTDERALADPIVLGLMAQEQIVRANLIGAIRRVGAQAVRNGIQSLADVSVMVASADGGAVYEATFSAHGIVDILDSYVSGRRREDPGIIGYPMAGVLDLIEQGM